MVVGTTQIGSEVSDAFRPRHVAWAEAIFAHGTFPDERLRKRAVRLLVDKVRHPAPSITRSCRGHAAAKGAYRLLSNARIHDDHLWGLYAQFTARVASEFTSFYVVHDISCLSYLTLKHTAGLGTAQTATADHLWRYSSLALRSNGHALGLMHARVWARPVEEFKQKPDHHTRAIEDKESYEWVQGVDAVAALRPHHFPRSRPIHVMDIGGDIHEVYERILKHGHGCIIRCGNNRRVEGESRYIKQAVAESAVLGRGTIEIPRCKAQRARQARVELRALRITARPSVHADSRRRPFEMNVVMVSEPRPPQGVEPVQWILCTTEPVATAQDCWAVVRGYRYRWRIEDYPLVLKSGCHAEATQLKTADGIKKRLAFLAPVAVRILRLRDLARDEPGLPCTEVLEGEEWKALWSYVHGRVVPAGLPPPTLGEAVRMIGRVGGHLGRAGDGMPGVRTLWRGLSDLELLLIGWRLAKVDP